MTELALFLLVLWIFSLATITTVGYGDITPVHPWAHARS